MELLNKFEKIAQKAAKLTHFDIVYHPGIIAEMDVYEACNEELSIHCYGPTEEAALNSARLEASARFMEETTWAEEFIKKTLAKNKKTH